MSTISRRAPIVLGGAFVIWLLAAMPAGAAFQDTDGNIELSVLQAIILGLVEGLTEYLPVSSTGHLLVTNELLGLNETAASEAAIETYAICIQVGAIIAVLFLYQERIRQMIDGLLGRSEEGRRILIAVIIAFTFTAIIGLSLQDIIRERFFGVGPIAGAWLVGGIGILILSRTGWFDRTTKELGSLTWQNAVVIGLIQAIAIWPGVSRSMITIIGAVLICLLYTSPSPRDRG